MDEGERDEISNGRVCAGLNVSGAKGCDDQ
jgi:hypothetical protein